MTTSGSKFFNNLRNFFSGIWTLKFIFQILTFALLKPMPHELIKVYDDMVNINLKDFFGFCLAEIECPKNIIPRRPLLIHKHNGKVIHSTGR